MTSKRRLVSSKFHLPYDPSLVARARELRKNMTPAERKLWYEYLRSFPYRVLKQRPIDRYIVDFYRPHLQLVIEFDGDSHCTETGETSDKTRTAVLESYGLTVKRFTNAEVLKSFEGVCGILESMLEDRKEIPPSPP